MTARVSRHFSFDAAMHCDNTFMINHYELKLYIDVMTENVREQNIALERIKFMFDSNLENSIFVNEANQEAMDKYRFAGLRICPLPEEPFDQIVAAVIMSKLNAITENKMFISEIIILSKVCDDVSFHISHNEDMEFRQSVGVWYTDPTPCICLFPKKDTKNKKIVPLKKDSPGWNDLGLGWTAPDPSEKNNEIVFTNTDTTSLH